MENRYRREASMAAATRLLMSSILPKRTSARSEGPSIPYLLRHGWRSANGLDDLGGQSETHVLGHDFDFTHVGETLLFQESHGLLHQDLGGRGARRQTYRIDVFQPLRFDRAIVLDEMGLCAQIAGDFDQAIGVGAVVGADNQEKVTFAGDILYRGLPVLRGIANVLRVRPLDIGEPLPERRDDVAGFVETQRGLRQISDAVGIGNLQVFHVLRRVHHLGHVGRFAKRANDFIVVAMADEDERIAFPSKLDGFNMDLGDQRAGGINHPQLTQLAGVPHFGRDPGSAVDDALAGRDFLNAVHKDGALGAQLVHHITVVDDLFAHVNRRSKVLQGYANDVNGANHAGAKAPRLQ